MSSSQTPPQGRDDTGAVPRPAQLLVMTDALESELQEELQRVLVRLDEELMVSKDGGQEQTPVATPPANEDSPPLQKQALLSPPALKQLLASQLIAHCLAPTRSGSSDAPFSLETMRLAAEVVYSCCRSSPLVVDALLSKHKLIPLVDLGARCLHQMHAKHAHAVQAASNGHGHLPPVTGAGGAPIVSVHAPPAPPSFLEFVFLTLTVVLKEPEEMGATAAVPAHSRSCSAVEDKKPLPAASSEDSAPASSAVPAPHRRVQLKQRNDFVRYICLSELLKRVVHHLGCIDRYMTLVAPASVSVTSLANAAVAAASSAPGSALSSPTAHTAPGRVTPPTSAVSLSRTGSMRVGGTAKDRLSAKLASQRSLKSKDSTPSKCPSPAIGGWLSSSQPLPHVPIHTPVVPHASFVACIANFFDALTTVPADATNTPAAAATTSAGASAKKGTAASTFQPALERALKDCMCMGVLALVASVTLSHWIIPTSKVTAPNSTSNGGHNTTPPHSSAAAAATVMAPTSLLSSRDKALSTVLSNESAGLLASSLHMLSNIARVDLPLLQEFSDSFQPHLFGILSFLLPYCLAHLPKPNITTHTLANTLIELLISLIGSLALLAPANQRMMTQWRDEAETTQAQTGTMAATGDEAATAGSTAVNGGAAPEGEAPSRPPTLFQQLCHLPSQFYTEARLQALLFPTLLACAYDPTSASHTATCKQILAAELVPLHLQLLLSWVEQYGSGAGASGLTLSFDGVAADGGMGGDPVRSPSSASLRPSPPPMSPGDSAKSAPSASNANGSLAKKRSSSAAGSVVDPAPTAEFSAGAAAPALSAVPLKAKRKPAVPTAASARSSLKAKDAAAVAAAVAATMAAIAPTSTSAASKSARAATPAGKSAASSAASATETAAVPAAADEAKAVSNTDASTPASGVDAGLPLAPAPLLSPAARGDPRRFPTELLRAARSLLFD